MHVVCPCVPACGGQSAVEPALILPLFTQHLASFTLRQPAEGWLSAGVNVAAQCMLVTLATSCTSFTCSEQGSVRNRGCRAMCYGVLLD